MASNPLMGAAQPGNPLAGEVPPPRQEPMALGRQPQQNANPLAGKSPEEMADMLHQTSYIAAAIRDLFMKKASPNAQDVIGEMGKLVASEVFDPKAAAQYLSTLPTDPMQIKPWLLQHQQNAMAASQHIAQALSQGAAQPVQGAQPIPGSQPMAQQPQMAQGMPGSV